MKSKNKLKFYRIYNEYWKAQLSLYVGSKELYNKKMKELKMDDATLAQGNTNGKFWHDENYLVMWFPNFKDKNIITHELVHYCFAVLVRKGVPISAENDEVFAYMFEYMFNKIMSYEK